MDEEMEAKPAFSEVNTELLAVAVDDAKDFVMQDQSNLDYDDVGHLFDESQDYNKLDHFDEGEGGELYPIMEEGEEMEDIGGMIQTAHQTVHEEMHGQERPSVHIQDGQDTTSIKPESMKFRPSDAFSRDIEVKDVGPQDRYPRTSLSNVSGDFIQSRQEVFPASHSYDSLMDQLSALTEQDNDEEDQLLFEEEEEEEGEDVEESETSAEGGEEQFVDREPYYELYKTLMKEYPMLRMKNNFLQRKMAEYFKRRKMEHALRESERIGDAQVKYYKKLDTLWDLRNTNNMQRSAITTELNEMKALRDKQVKNVVENFEAMQNREREIGKGLIFTKTAKEIPEKLLDRLLKNQRTKSKEIMEMRLCYIRLRNNIEEITAAIKAMDKIGENHTLIDYEQLKMENQNHADKIEERDEELSKLRIKCTAAIQTLAHLREKSSSTDIDILEMNDKLDEVELERNDWREKVNELKKERDSLRANIMKLQEESGLLTKPKLLLDMEDTLEQIAACKNELQRIHATYNQKAKALDAIKRNIVDEKDCLHAEKSKVSRSKPKIWKGKTRLVYPVLEKFNIKEFSK